MIFTELLSFILLILLGGNGILLLFLPSVSLWSSFFLVIVLLILSVFDISDVKMQEVLTLSSIYPLLLLILIVTRPNNLYIQAYIVYGFLLLLSIAYRFLFKHIKVSYTRNYSHFFLPVIIGGIVLGFIYSHVLPIASSSHIPLIVALVSLPVVAYIEELYFRGLIQNAFSSFGVPLNAILYTSALYVLFHLTYIPLYLLAYFIYSVIASTLYNHKKNIFLPIAFHISVNVVFFLLTNQFFILGGIGK